ncbi:MAG: lysylphosphatidylglycerol synthase transmembrane domain-containing protein [Sedimentisphaerales bacterium]|jgi:uncharacterized protein (TIRG00374 family)
MPESKSRRSKYVFLGLRLAVVSVGVIWGVFWISQDQRWATLGALFSKMNPAAFIVALGVYIVCQFIVGFRWWLLLRVQYVFIGVGTAIKLYLLGWFYNNFMPSSVGGDLVRAWYVTRHTDKRFEAVLSVFVDRAVGLLSTLVIAAFFYLVFLTGQGQTLQIKGRGGSLAFFARHALFFLCVFLAICVVLGTLASYRRTRPVVRKVASYLYLRGRLLAGKFKIAAKVYCKRPGTILIAFVLTVGTQIVVITSFWALGVSMGISAGLRYYYVFFTLMWVVAAVPVSIGGAVVMEGGLAYLFVHFAGAEPEAALALALCQRVVWMLASVPGALIHLSGAHLPKDFFVDSREPVA